MSEQRLTTTHSASTQLHSRQKPRLDLASSRGVPSNCGGPGPTGALTPLNSQNKAGLISVETVFLRKQIVQTKIL